MKNVRHAQVQPKLDAYYARIYGLARDELRYILDPKEVHAQTSAYGQKTAIPLRSCFFAVA